MIMARDSTSYMELSHQIKNKIKHQKILLKCIDGTRVVNFDDIYFIEAQNSYSRVVYNSDGVVKEIVISNSIAEYEVLLPAEIFYRIHRSYLINCNHISRICNNNSSMVIVKEDYALPVSRRRVSSLLSFLKSNKFL